VYNKHPQEQDVDVLIKKLDKYQIEKAIVFPFPSPLAQFKKDEFWYKAENDYLIDSWKKYLSRIVPIPGFHPKDLQSVDYACYLIEEYSLKGLKLHTRAAQTSPLELKDNYVMKKIHDNQLILILHIGTGRESEFKEKNTDISLESAIQLAKLYPDVKFVFAHLGRLHLSLQEALRLENVAIDTAGLSIKQSWSEFPAEKHDRELINKSPVEIIEYLVELGYEDKLIWGSDEPYGISYAEERNYILNTRIEERKKSKILFYNAKRFFDL
jgi:predicted TIM-barrel fold metal-dependent hydrolase